MKKVCEIEGCNEKATRKDMCQKHYRRTKVHGDPHKTNRRANGDGKGYHNIGDKGAHVLIAEKALGKPLPIGAVVHHINEDKSDNTPSNLVICPSMKYHALLHARMDALEATGNANYRKCHICLSYDAPQHFQFVKDGRAHHAVCNRAHVAKYSKGIKNVHI